MVSILQGARSRDINAQDTSRSQVWGKQGPQAALAFTMVTPPCGYVWGAVVLQRSKRTPDTPNHPKQNHASSIGFICWDNVLYAFFF